MYCPSVARFDRQQTDVSTGKGNRTGLTVLMSLSAGQPVDLIFFNVVYLCYYAFKSLYILTMSQIPSRIADTHTTGTTYTVLTKLE